MKSATTLAAATLLLAGVWTAGPARAQLSAEAAAVMSGPILYLPASPSDPGGLNGYDHNRQFDFAIEADKPGKNKAERDKVLKKPKKAVAGPKVKAGTYTLGAAPGQTKK
ncbi:hypothetical protein CupriaWKF_24480 [Cupriavidus sp. WKF15]|uniref:hypothetical protein n=1 Tax=Cupriavidus sp. WKF15 TaxID=3032282 RepID=UPI0023E17BFF|nr:hypothetical protein [Cupriavidus sp. WKF15]WER47974.1 hypothetical protein CupriaWKF_24480 [Cupriavidus sp. WKF15]